MTSPPQPHRPLIFDDLDVGVSGAMAIGTGGKRKAINDRQRKAAEKQDEHDRWRRAMIEQIWGRP